MLHRSAGPSLYDREAATYDLFNEENSATVNRTLTTLLRSRRARTILDVACGTGSQVFWLARRGFTVAGRDLSPTMLRIARRKARANRVRVDLRRGDMRACRAAPRDAVVAISNAVGHLTRPDFERAMRNIRGLLVPGGIFVFDIFNLDVLRTRDHIARLAIDWAKRGFRQVQHSTIDEAGVLRSYTTCRDRTGLHSRVETLQVYRPAELRDMLRRSGFGRVRHCGIDGSPFSRATTDRILTIAEAGS